MSQLQVLRHKILTDQNFRKLLTEDPAAALQSVGISPTPQNVALIKNVISSIENFYEAFDKDDDDNDADDFVT
jgi:hypothetical protein